MGGLLVTPPQAGPSIIWAYPDVYTRVNDSEIVAATHLAGATTPVGFIPYTIPPRTRIVRGLMGGDTLPTSGSTGSMRFQFYNGNEVDLLPTTRIGDPTTVVVAGSGSIADQTAPPYAGILTGGGLWWGFWTPASEIANLTDDPLFVHLGVHMQGNGAFTSGDWYSGYRQTVGPTVLRASAESSWPYTFADNPAVGGQGSGDVEARPLIVLQLERVA